MPLAKTSVVNIYYESGWGGDQSETKLNINSRISGVIVLNCLIYPDEQEMPDLLQTNHERTVSRQLDIFLRLASSLAVEIFTI